LKKAAYQVEMVVTKQSESTEKIRHHEKYRYCPETENVAGLENRAVQVKITSAGWRQMSGQV